MECGIDPSWSWSTESFAKVTYRIGEVMADASAGWQLLASNLEDQLKSDRGNTNSKYSARYMERAIGILIGSRAVRLDASETVS